MADSIMRVLPATAKALSTGEEEVVGREEFSVASDICFFFFDSYSNLKFFGYSLPHKIFLVTVGS